jgi:hypothetical protein
MSKNAFSKSESQLIKLGARSASRQARWVPFLLYLFPASFVSIGLMLIAYYDIGKNLVLCLRVDDELIRLNIPVLLWIRIGVFIIGAILMLAAYLVVRIWRERRLYYAIIKRLNEHLSGDL